MHSTKAKEEGVLVNLNCTLRKGQRMNVAQRMSYEEEDTCASYEEEDTCLNAFNLDQCYSVSPPPPPVNPPPPVHHLIPATSGPPLPSFSSPIFPLPSSSSLSLPLLAKTKRGVARKLFHKEEEGEEVEEEKENEEEEEENEEEKKDDNDGEEYMAGAREKDDKEPAHVFESDDGFNESQLETFRPASVHSDAGEPDDDRARSTWLSYEEEDSRINARGTWLTSSAEREGWDGDGAQGRDGGGEGAGGRRGEGEGAGAVVVVDLGWDAMKKTQVGGAFGTLADFCQTMDRM
jgi:hypothetical protein